MKRIKNMYKDGMGLAVTGIGLGAVSGLDETGSVGKFTGAMPTVANIMVAGHVMGVMKDSMKKLKK